MSVSEHHLAESSQTIDPVTLGRRLKNARIAAGLTQTEMAGAEASAAYVSRIESGQRRPSFALLTTLAERVGTPLETLLAEGVQEHDGKLLLELDYAELSLRSGNAAAAMERVTEVLAQLEGHTDPEIERRARLVEALAFEVLGQADEAIAAFERILARPEERTVLRLKAAVALSRCYRESGELTKAVTSGEAVMAELRGLGLEATDEAIQLTVTIAAAYFEAGDVRQAVRLCREAVDRAEELGSARAKASAYWNASILESEAGQVASAISLAEHALQLLDRDEDMRSLSRLESQLGMFLLRLQPPDVEAARVHLDLARRGLEWSQATPLEKSLNDTGLARAHLLAGEHDEARSLLLKTLAETGDSAPLLQAEILVLLGQVEGTSGQVAAAREYFRRAILVLTGIKADRLVAQRWLELGTLLDQIGLGDEARDAYRRAALSTGLSDPQVSVPAYV